MKKVVMTGLMVAAMACGAQAATVYDKDGTKVDLKGDLQIQLRQKVGEDQDLYMDYDDLTVGFNVKHDTESGVLAFGTLKMDWKKQADGSAKAAVDEGFIGLDFGTLSVDIGRLDWGSDKFEIDQAVEIGDGVRAFPKDGGYESIKATLDMGLAKLMVSADLEVKDNASATEAYLVTNPKELFGLEMGLLFQSFQPETEEDAEKPDSIDTVGVRAMYSINKIKLGVDYSTNDDKDVMNVSVGMPIMDTGTSVAAGMAMAMPDEGDDVNTWYANIKHKVHKNATIFAEIGGNDKDDTDLGYLAGMKLKF